MLRYGISSIFLPHGYPYATLGINLVGSFLIGVLFGLFTPDSNQSIGPALLMSGFCGGFTTFSAFSLENVQLIEHEQTLKALLYAAFSVIGGVGCCWLGKWLVS